MASIQPRHGLKRMSLFESCGHVSLVSIYDDYAHTCPFVLVGTKMSSEVAI